jgi:hypothetical protein
MTRTALLLIASGDNWWRHPAREALARAVFARWWQGVPTAALLAEPNAAAELPVAPERIFLYRKAQQLTPALRIWLYTQRIGLIVDYQHGLRIELARQLLAQGLSVERAADGAGFASARDLRRIWKRHATGTPAKPAQ